MKPGEEEDNLIRSVALQNAQSIFLARQRADDALLRAKDGLEQRTAELALSLSMTRATLEASRDGILATDDEGNITGFNQQYIRMWGLADDAMATRSHSHVLGLLSQRVRGPEEFLHRIKTIYQTSPADSFDLLELVDGRLYERTSTIQFVYGKNVGRVWVFRDITASRQAEEALQEETRILEVLNRTGSVLTSKLDVKTLVQAVTDAATDISGARFGAFFYGAAGGAAGAESGSLMLYALSGAVPADFDRFGQPRATALFGPTFRGEPAVRIHDVMADARYGRSSPHHGMPEGHPPVRSYLAVPVMGGSGDVIGGLFFGHPQPGVFNERAERLVIGIAAQAGVALDNARLYEAARHAAEEREVLLENERAARAEAEEMSLLKDQFLAMLAHELRNPLAPLRNSVEILRRKGAAPEKLEDTRAMMERQISNMTRLVDDLLDVSRVSRGKLELRLQQINLADAIASAVETSRPGLAAGRHRLGLNLPDDPVLIPADLVRISQALTNVLNNAARYTPEGGHIALKVEPGLESVSVIVEDTGIGLPAELGDRIFDMFVQGSAVSSAQGGLGIGLTLVRSIVEMHGGSVNAENRSDRPGSRFVVRLPRTPAVSRAPAVAPRVEGMQSPILDRPVPAIPKGEFKPRRILVADDNVDAAATLGQLLEMMGHRVSLAHDGVEAVDAAGAFQPDMIFLDIGMPRMDGYDACRMIRKLDGTASGAVIVALTGWGQTDDKRKAMEAGFDHHITKPADPAQLEALAGSEF